MAGSVSIPTHRPVWLLFETLIWVLTMAVSALLVSYVAALGYLALVPEGAFEGSIEQALALLDDDGIFAALHVLALGGSSLLLLYGIIRVQHIANVRQVLGLVMPGPWIAGVWLAATCLLLLAEYGVMTAFDLPMAPEEELVPFRHAPWLTALAVVVIAPLWEEVVFRGYLHSCFAHSVIGPAGAILLTSALWSLGHPHFSGPQLLHIFVFGVLLGLARHTSGSSLLPVAMHAMSNGVVIWHLQHLAN